MVEMSARRGTETDGCVNTRDLPNAVAPLSASGRGVDCVSQLSPQMKVTSETIHIVWH